MWKLIKITSPYRVGTSKFERGFLIYKDGQLHSILDGAARRYKLWAVRSTRSGPELAHCKPFKAVKAARHYLGVPG